MRTHYTQAFRDEIVKKLLTPNGPSVIQLSNETGVSRSALYKWLDEHKNNYDAGDVMKNGNNIKRPQNWSRAAKLNAVFETFKMTDDEKSAYCRENGIYMHNLDKWKTLMLNGLEQTERLEQKTEITKLKSEIKTLESDIKRKDKALAETTALIVLKKKADLIWGVEKED